MLLEEGLFDFDELDTAAAAAEVASATEPSEANEEPAVCTVDPNGLEKLEPAPAVVAQCSASEEPADGQLAAARTRAAAEPSASHEPQTRAEVQEKPVARLAEASAKQTSASQEPPTCIFDFDGLDEAQQSCNDSAHGCDNARAAEDAAAALEDAEREVEETRKFCREANRTRVSREEERAHEAAGANVELELELKIQLRLQPQEGETERGVAGAVLTVEEPGGGQAFFCDALNDSLSKLQRLLAREDKVAAAGAEGFRDRLNVMVAFLSGILQQRFTNGARPACARLVSIFQGLCSTVKDWLDHAVKEKPLQRLEELGASARVLRDGAAVLHACRSARIDCSNDGLRLAALGRPAQVLERDPSDNTARCDVEGLGDVWFPVSALTLDAAVVSSGGSAAASALRAAATQLRALLNHAVVRSKLEQRWLHAVLREVCKALAAEGAAEGAAPWRPPEDVLAGELSAFAESWLVWVLAHRVAFSRIWRSSPLSATRLLHELRTRFQAASFQERYRASREAAELAFGESHLQTLDLTFAEQAAVLPKYGFAALPRGVTEMRHEMELLMAVDPVVWKLVRDVHVLLGQRDMPRELLPQVRDPRFHTVGDSHCTFGWPLFVVQHFIGSVLCYNVDRLDVRELRPPVLRGDALCFCFGEIDCRCHVRKHCSAERTYQDVIDEVVARYFAHLRAQALLLPENVQFYVYNVVPPAPARVLYPDDVLKYLNWGTDDERRNYALYFNQRLRLECGRAGYRFFDIYNDYTGEDGMLIHSLSDGRMHIQDGRYIARFMQRMYSG